MKWTARGGPSVFGFHIRRDRARHAAPRDANARRGGRRGPFRLWIFSYQILRSLANLMLSRLNVGVALALIALADHCSPGGKPYRKFPQKRWMRSHASCSAVVAVA